MSIDKARIFDFLCITAVYLFSLKTILSGIHYQIIASILTFPYLIHILRQCRNCSSGMYIFILYSIITLICSVLNTFFTLNGIGGCLILLATLTLGGYCIENLSKLRFHILIIIVINCIYIIYNVMILGINPNAIYESVGLSRNHGGMILCLFTGFYCYILYMSYHKVSIIIPLFALFCAYVMVGRSSMGLLAGLLLISLCARDKKIIAILISILILSIYISFREEIEILYSASSFAEHGMESSRFMIWSSYFNHLRLDTIVFGPETTEIPIVMDYGGNPHNSFLNFHRRFGLVPLFIYIVLSIVAIWKYCMNKKYYIAIIMLIIYARIFFDSDCFIGSYDYILYTFVFYPLFQFNKKKYYHHSVIIE